MKEPIPHLSNTEVYALLTLTVASLAIVVNVIFFDTSSSPVGNPIISSIAFAISCFTLTYSLIRWMGPKFIKAGLKGKDMGKAKQTVIPECMGAVCAIVYLLALILFIPFPFYKDIVAATSGGGNRDVVLVETGRLLHMFPHNKLASYLSAILSLQVIVLLGICDDLFDIRWRYKIAIPAIASAPLLMVYYVDFGVTQVVMPVALRPYLGDLLDLGLIYYLYMVMFATFCSNSINILAGINGIEVGQSMAIAGLILINDLLYLYPSSPEIHPATDSHLHSVYLLVPFMGVSAALFMHNRYPAKVFVGDTYCYFAGMVFAIDGILGHFSKTLWLLLVPQIFNFIYSAPQLFGIIECPRHRLPRFNGRSGGNVGRMVPSFVEFSKPLPRWKQTILKLLHSLKVLQIKLDNENSVTECSNLTIINLWLIWFGPLGEGWLMLHLVALQIVCGIGGLFVRHRLALMVFASDNLAL